MKAEKFLADYAKRLHDKGPEIARRVAERGAETAAEIFAGAAYPGTNDVTVTTEQDGDATNVVASGQSVLFIEYGTGVRYEEYPGERPEGVVPHGEYGQRRGRNKSGWLYKGDPGQGGLAVVPQDKDGNPTAGPGIYRTWGNPPAAAMYRASEEMREHAAETVKEVIK